MKILSERDPLEVFSEASAILNKAVEHTLGPEGTNTAVHFHNYYNIINDGKSIIEQLTSLDPEIAPAIETLKQSSFETNRKAGDGTTSTIVIMDKLIQGAKEYLEENPDKSRVWLANRILETEKKLQDLILRQKATIDNNLYNKVAKVSLGSSEYSEMISETFNFLNSNGIPALVKSDIPGVEVEYIEGVNLTKTSVASSMFIDLLPSKELKNVQVITMFQCIDRFEEMFQLVKLLNQNKDKYTVLLYNEISSSALENLLFNLSQDRSKIIPICMKNYGKDMNNMFDEIAKYTETDIIDGGKLKATDISKIKIGFAGKAILSQESLVLIREEAPEYDYKFISKKACIIRVGGATKIDMEDTYRRLEDAIYSLAGAIEHGAFFGGYGSPYSSLATDIDDVGTPSFISDALRYINQNIFNGQADADAIDSALVISQVIRNSFITAAHAITTYAIVYDNIR
ncbi:MAG: hypothetical protein IJF92_00155 [Bacilli bacterium]|nr:hypothetical protein [Bacilli bacterium]MBQ3307598.1 hypothetical protein [Bacilli bacterium]